MKNRITIFALMLLTLNGLAQEQPGNRERAYRHIYEYQYARAIPLLLKEVDIKHPRVKDMEQLANSYYQVNDYVQACNWYARVLETPDTNPENLLKYAQSLKQISEYDEAKKMLGQYAQKTGNNQAIVLEIAGCEAAIKWLANPKAYTLQNEKEINTEKSEFGAYPVDNQVYFTGEAGGGRKKHYGWTGNSFLKVFKAGIDSEKQLIQPQLVGSINNKSKYHVGPVSTNKSGDIFYVTRTYYGRKENKGKDGNKKYLSNKLELSIYKRNTSGDWQTTPFPYNNVKEYSTGHAALSPDGKELYFVSDMPGGMGGADIWYCELDSQGNWTTPKNAGNIINSPQDEMFPSIAPDGTLYYSSNGFINMGGLDVFKSEGSKASWSAPENLQYPVNSGGDDFAFVVSKMEGENLYGYVSSNRAGGIGGDDIYSFTYAKPKMYIALEGTTYEGKSTEKILAQTAVTLFNNVQRQLIAKKQSTATGQFIFEIDPDKTYKILGQKQRYYSDSLMVNTKDVKPGDTLRIALHLEPLFEEGKKFVLEDMHYDFDKHNIRKDATIILNELVTIMRKHPTLKIELSSHTDSRGNNAYNMSLSQSRAQSAVDYLVSKGIARNRMTAKGYGESQLLNECSDGVSCSSEAHEENRRTEVKVLAF
ncbi:OmpA family protein [Galbibacter sp. EGI 63066]|uniref:OmpA family protein n=1 Tax=Galbibacter sp. EGI 63066 TaxID=2993559 RepID=UPI0022496EBD|nr:OmpA family protein [Galbibacter sp. EGI 63066]MCX2681608.1 OmpA family protein [Galbibacter sp. EGI 63066]